MRPAVGVDLGGTKVQGVVIDDDASVLGQARTRTPTKGGPDAVVEAIADVVKAAAKDAKVSVEKLAGVGVGSPGRVEGEPGTVHGAANLPGFDDPVPLGKLVARELQLDDVVVDNDVNASALAEHRLGGGRAFDDLLVVFVGSGVGAGLILDGQLRRGPHGAAGEIGHMVVVRDGELCPCGRPTELLAIQQRAGRPRMTSGVFATALEAGDPLAHELIEGAVKALGAGIASAVNLLDVQAVLIGGGLGDRLGDGFVRRVETAMAPHLFVRPSPLQVVTSTLGDLAGALGAAQLVREAA